MSVESVTRAICREKCAFRGEPPCWSLPGEFPPPLCSEPGCKAEAEAALSATEKSFQARFGHHPDPAIDYCVEVECLEGIAINIKLGISDHPDFLDRLNRAADFKVGGDPNAVSAKLIVHRLLADFKASKQSATPTARPEDDRYRILYEGMRGERDNALAQVTTLRRVVTDLIALHDRNTCLHEETRRGGSIWTICESCGKKWADDEGGFKPYVDPPAVATARTLMKGDK